MTTKELLHEYDHLRAVERTEYLRAVSFLNGNDVTLLDHPSGCDVPIIAVCPEHPFDFRVDIVHGNGKLTGIDVETGCEHTIYYDDVMCSHLCYVIEALKTITNSI